MAIPEKPLSRVEQYAEAIYQKLSGGGNPNSMESAGGSLANPWGRIDFSKILEEKNRLGCTIMLLTHQNAALGLPETLLTASMASNPSSIFFVSAGGISTASDLQSALVVDLYYTKGNLTKASVLSNGSLMDVTQYASMVETTLHVIHHPLPDSD